MSIFSHHKQIQQCW